MTQNSSHLLSITNEHAEPGSDFAVSPQQEATYIRDQRTDGIICCVRPVVQSQSHT